MLVDRVFRVSDGATLAWARLLGSEVRMRRDVFALAVLACIPWTWIHRCAVRVRLAAGILMMMCMAQEYESKAADVRAKQAARRGETAAEEDAENDDKGSEVSMLFVCLCVLHREPIYMCLYALVLA